MNKKTQKKPQNSVSQTQKTEKQNSLLVFKTVSQKTFLILLGIIAMITFLTYSPTFQNAATNWDDDAYVTSGHFKNLSSKTLHDIFFGTNKFYMGNYHPLTMTSLALNYQMTGIQPFSYQLTNILLHILTTLFVLWFVYLLIKDIEIAFIASLLFGINAIHVESVSWLSERKDVLYSAFFVAALVAYVKYLDTEKIKFYLIGIFLFFLSLLSKGQAVSLAVTLIAVDFVRERNLLSKKVIFEKIPFFLLAILFGLIAVKAQGEAVQDITDYEMYKRVAFASYSFVQYLVKTTIPYPLCAMYPYPDIITRSVPPHYWLFVIPTILIGFLAILSVKKKWNFLAFGIWFYIFNIALLLQFIPVGGAILSDRYAYIPSIGWCFLAGFLYKFLISKFSTTYVQIAFSLYAILLILLTLNRIPVWKDSLSLWNDVLEKEPRASVAWNNRGSTKNRLADSLAKKGFFDESKKLRIEAVYDFDKAMETKPDYHEAAYNRGILKKELKDFNGALQDFELAILFKPQFADAYLNRGTIKDELGKFKEAIEDFNKAYELNPNLESIFVNRGVSKGKMGKYKEAIEDLNTAIEKSPNNPTAYSNRGMAKNGLGDKKGAFQDYSKAIELDPTFATAYFNRGIIHQQLENFKGAVQDFSKVIDLRATYLEAYYFRAMAFVKLGDKENACKDLQTAYKSGVKYALKDIQTYCK